MKNIIWKFGLGIGFAMALVMIIGTLAAGTPPDYGVMEIIGYTGFILSALVIVLGIKVYRDRIAGGKISYRKGFTVGIGITAVAALVVGIYTFVHIAWMDPDFGESYIEWQIEEMKSEGIAAAELEREVVALREKQEMLGSPFMQAIVMYATILVIGLLITLISAAILKNDSDKDVAIA